MGTLPHTWYTVPGMLHAFKLLHARSELCTEALYGSGRRLHHVRKKIVLGFRLFEENIGVSIHIQGRYMSLGIRDAITDR